MARMEQNLVVGVTLAFARESYKPSSSHRGPRLLFPWRQALLFLFVFVT